MPIKIPNGLPAAEQLFNENIFVMNEFRAETQDIRPLKIVLLNLMPTKIVTETQFSRLLGNTPLQVELTLLKTSSHESKNTSKEHMIAFYKTFDEIKDEKFDGMVITGAPVEQLDFEKVDYWKRNIAITVVCFALVAVMSVLYYFFVHEPITQNNIYQNAVTLIETKTAKGYCEASVILRELGDYKDAKEQLKKISLEITDGERDDAYLTTSEEMYYLQLSDTTAGLITYDSERYTFKSDLIIPDYLDGYKVTAIDAQACQNAKELTKLTLPRRSFPSATRHSRDV